MVKKAKTEPSLIGQKSQNRTVPKWFIEEIMKKKLGIYIHIPFCVKKCNYCDFNSFASDKDMQMNYITALCEEMKRNSEAYKDYVVDTVFVGGGTPSILVPDLTKKFFDYLYSNYKIDSNAEISMESNPGTLTKEKAKAYKEIGINRMSLGLQSTVDSELKILGRIHTYNEFLESFMILRDERFNNINVDLMNGIPEQTFETFSNGLEIIKELNPEHISIYSLILEEGTPFYSMNLKLPNEEEERRMVHSIPEILGSEYHQYEISNYSKRGFECKHNIKYWKRDEYLGFGLSAASFMNETRFKNTDDIKVYLDNSDNKNVYTEYEVLNKDEQMSEYIILGLRMNEGVDITDFEKTFGKSVYDVYGDKIALHIKEELLERKNNHLFLTEKGRDLANYVWSDFLGD